MSINRYAAIKRLNKSNFINLLSSCDESTLHEIFPVRKHDLLKLMSDRLTKQELQDIMYNLQDIDTKTIVNEYALRVKHMEEKKEALKEKEPNVKKTRLPEFTDETTSKLMDSYLNAYKKCKGDVNKQNDLISVIRDKSKQECIGFYNNTLNILKQRELPIFNEIHEILMLALSTEQQKAVRRSIMELEIQ